LVAKPDVNIAFGKIKLFFAKIRKEYRKRKFKKK